jgi:recombination associated protein RdgC
LELKNIHIYRLAVNMNLTAETIEPMLADFALTPCGSQDMAKTGWVSPMGSLGETLVHAANGQILICARKEEKIIPSSVIKNELQAKIDKLESEQHRTLKKTEKDYLKDEVLHTLLPRAFSRFSQTYIWIDSTNNLIVVDTASARRAEDALALLRKSLGSLPVVPLTMESPIELTITEWVRSGKAPAGFTLQDEAELKAVLEEGGIIRCKKQDLFGDEIATNIEAGKLVTKLALEWQERISFVLTDTGSLKRLEYSEALLCQNDDFDHEDFAARFDANFVLITGELARLISELTQALGGEVNRGTTESDWVSADGTKYPHDTIYPEAVKFVQESGRATISNIQRHFRIGYNRAAILIERMQIDSVVSSPAQNGSRTVLNAIASR